MTPHPRRGSAFTGATASRSTWSSASSPAPGELYWTISDRTEQLQSEERLWELNRELERDVTEQVAQRHELVSRLPVGVMFVRDDGHAAWLNERAREILGTAASLPDLDAREVQGRKLADSELPWRRALTGETVRGARVAVTLGGVETILAVTAAPVDDAGGAGAVVVFGDVTERATAGQAAAEFTQNAAHQLRTPIAAIASSVAALEAGAQHDAGERARFLGHIGRESERMGHVVDALLTLEGLERGTARALVEIVPLHDFLERAAAGAGGEPGRVAIECNAELAFVGDEDLLGQAVENVIANALVHSGDGPVTIRAQRAGNTVAVDVTDSGPGVPEEQRARIFERFFRGPAPASRGAGLGLAIAAAATAASGGELVLCAQRAGEGATFRFTLPVAELL